MTSVDLSGFPYDPDVDNSTEVASSSANGTLADMASVALTIPSHWNTWKCKADATMRATGGSFDTVWDIRIVIDGANQQTIEDVTCPADEVINLAVSARRTGISSTGSVTVSLQAAGAGASATPLVSDIFLYARAVRTS